MQGDLLRIRLSDEEVESLARQNHEDWLEMMEGQGYHRASFCPHFGHGCDKCNPDMVSYEELSDDIKEREMLRIRKFVRNLSELGYVVIRHESGHPDIPLVVLAPPEEK